VMGLSFPVENAGTLDYAYVNLGISEDVRPFEISMEGSRPMLLVPVILGHVHNEKLKSESPHWIAECFSPTDVFRD
jgi:hypothetical protein